MTICSAKVIASSISSLVASIYTLQLRYPGWIHPEVMTHRDFSRNAASWRAIPIEKVLAAIAANMAIPMHWGLNEKGMQAKRRLTEKSEIAAAVALWKEAGRKAMSTARDLHDLLDLHKQVVNRLLQPFCHYDTIVTATSWNNFFALRCHPATEPHMRLLSWRVAEAIKAAKPTLLQEGEWHLPYVTAEEKTTLPLDVQKACSTARCARVSYLLHDGTKTDPVKDQDLVTKLLAGLGKDDNEPGHMSPFEHQATPLKDATARSGNFVGWLQHRKTIPGEVMGFDYEAAVARGWREDAFAIEPSSSD